MHIRNRAAQVEVHYPRDAFIAALQQALPLAESRVEQVLYFLLPCLLWGLIIYVAASFA